MTGSILIGGRDVGANHPCFIVAEAGVNHNGDPKLAHDLIDVAADSKADAVKFQTFDPDWLVSADVGTAPYQKRETGEVSQREMLSSLMLPRSAWRELADHTRDRGLVFLSAPFDLGSADLLQELGAPAFKVASGELTNLPFIGALAERGLPLLISTGMGTLEEVGLAVDAARRAPAVCLFHCVSAYPAPTEESNLRAIRTLQDHFEGVPVGWSDHTEGFLSAVGAIALGASLLEKHFTLDRLLPGPDHAASADPEEFAEYVRAVRCIEQALGDGEKRTTPSEADNLLLARRSLHAARDLKAGERLSPDDVLILRPALGLPPHTDPSRLRLVRDVPQGRPITAGDVDGLG